MKSHKQRLYLLDGLRGICAVLVMGYHYLFWNGVDIFQVGSFGVYLFFVISGFSLWYVYVQTSKPVTEPYLRSFFIARIARIFPLYCLVLLISLSPGFEATVIKKYLLNLTFLFGTSEPILTSGVFAGWSIGIEWVFYILFPFLWLFMRNIWVLLGAFALAIAINQVYMWDLITADYPRGTCKTFMSSANSFRSHSGPMVKLSSFIVQYVNFPVFLVYFITGILAAHLHGLIKGAVKERKYDHIGISGIVGLLLFVIFVYPSKTLEEYLWGYHFIFLIVLCLLITLLSACRHNPSKVEKVICTFLGNISYSTYLLHFLVYKAAHPKIKMWFPSMSWEARLVVLCIFTVMISWFVHRFYEMPARKYIKQKFVTN